MFASDRSHMKKEDGTWIAPPPSYPCIQTQSKSIFMILGGSLLIN